MLHSEIFEIFFIHSGWWPHVFCATIYNCVYMCIHTYIHTYIHVFIGLPLALWTCWLNIQTVVQSVRKSTWVICRCFLWGNVDDDSHWVVSCMCIYCLPCFLTLYLSVHHRTVSSAKVLCFYAVPCICSFVCLFVLSDIDTTTCHEQFWSNWLGILTSCSRRSGSILEVKV